MEGVFFFGKGRGGRGGGIACGAFLGGLGVVGVGVDGVVGVVEGPVHDGFDAVAEALHGGSDAHVPVGVGFDYDGGLDVFVDHSGRFMWLILHPLDCVGDRENDGSCWGRGGKETNLRQVNRCDIRQPNSPSLETEAFQRGGFSASGISTS